MTAKRYRRKPIEIEAMQWDGEAETAHPIIQWINATESTATYIGVGEPHSGRQTRMLDEYHVAPLEHGGYGHRRILNEDAPAFLSIRTLEGLYMRADAGDWIIRGVQGEFYPCKSDIFEATYERVADDERTDSVSEVRGDEAP